MKEKAIYKHSGIGCWSSPQEIFMSVFESKFEPINTSCCYLKCCLLLSATGEGGRERGIVGATQGEVRKWDWRSWLLTLLQTTSVHCLLWAWQTTERGERSLQRFCRPAVICRPKAMLGEVTCQVTLGQICWLPGHGSKAEGELAFPSSLLQEEGRAGRAETQHSFTQPWFESDGP